MFKRILTTLTLVAVSGGLALAAAAQPAAPAAPSGSAAAAPAVSGNSGAAAEHAAATAGAVADPGTPPWVPLAFTIAALLLGLLYFKHGLSATTATGQRWSLADALSEESTVTNAEGKPTTMMLASTSRLIALYGMLVILSIFLGVGVIVLWDLAVSGKTPSGLDAAMKLLTGGMSLFAPYIVNQVRSAFQSIGKQVGA
jgi:hypothetical protein